MFFPPELADTADFSEVPEGHGNAPTEGVRRLYFQRLYSAEKNDALDRELVRRVLDAAKAVIAHPSKPVVTVKESFSRFPFGDISLEESLEENLFLNNPEEILVEYSIDKRFTVTAILDCSSSMSGEKHLLASIAVAVMLLEVPAVDFSLVSFASTAQVVKRMLVDESAGATILRFLRQQPKGFTNIAEGLKKGLDQLRTAGRKRKVGLIATDGRSTEGDDPHAFASLFDTLVVLHLHGAGSHLDASKELAAKGNGFCIEVNSFEDLPRRIYDAVRILAQR